MRREDLERVAAGGSPEAVEMIALRDGDPREGAFRVPLDPLRDVCRGSKILGFSRGRVWIWDAASAAS
ncbi:MAG: hypothetical protein R3F14_47920 [Polyangiaceae bacterium]